MSFSTYLCYKTDIVTGKVARESAFSIGPITIASRIEVQGSIGYIALGFRSLGFGKALQSIRLGYLFISSCLDFSAAAIHALDIYPGIFVSDFFPIPFEA